MKEKRLVKFYCRYCNISGVVETEKNDTKNAYIKCPMCAASIKIMTQNEQEITADITGKKTDDVIKVIKHIKLISMSLDEQRTKNKKEIEMKYNQKIGKDAVVIGNVNADVGDGSVVINATDSNGNVILNRPMAIGRSAKADNTSIAIGANANAGYDINKALKDLSEIINKSKDEKLKIVFQDFLIEKGSGDHKKLGSLWHIIETSSTLSGCIAFVQQIGHALGLG